jgi:hypothetical protein
MFAPEQPERVSWRGGSELPTLTKPCRRELGDAGNGERRTGSIRFDSRPFPAPFLARGALPPLRSGQVSLDEAEPLLHNRGCQRRYAPTVFGFTRNAVRHPSRMSVQLRRNPQTIRTTVLNRMVRLYALPLLLFGSTI